jgi:uncharacterized membrane protein
MPTPSPRTLPPFLTAHGRLLLAVGLGVGVYLVSMLPPVGDLITSRALRIALAWDVVALTYLLLAIRLMRRPHDRVRIRARAKAVDISLPEIVGIAALAGIFSLFAVAALLARAKGLDLGDRVVHLAAGVVTVFLSWVALHTLFAVHYAHVYYDPAEKQAADGKDAVRGGLDFPGEKEPDYWDFLYFSVVVGMTCQVSDVVVTARTLRHIVTAQGIIAFFYNTVVLALAVNIAAGLG